LLDQVLGPRRQLGIYRKDSELLLVSEDRFAKLVPAIVEKVHLADLFDPLRCRVMRRMGCAGSIVDKEGLIRVECVYGLHVINRVIRHCSDQIEVGIVLERVDIGRVANQIARLPLAGVTAHEPVEIIEAHTDRPLIKWPDLTGGEIRRIVILAKPGRHVAVPLEYSCNRRIILGHDGVIAGVASRQFRYGTHTHLVVVASGEQSRPRRRADRCGVEVGVSQSIVCNAIHRWCGNDATEGAGYSVARIVGHDQENVGSSLRRNQARRPVGF